jgi:hypothetical protein
MSKYNQYTVGYSTDSVEGFGGDKTIKGNASCIVGSHRDMSIQSTDELTVNGEKHVNSGQARFTAGKGALGDILVGYHEIGEASEY